MKQKALSAGTKIRARYLAGDLRADALFETNAAVAVELIELADALSQLGAVSPGTPNEARALCVLDVERAMGWKRARAARWILANEAWERDRKDAWLKRYTKAASDQRRESLKQQREAEIDAYAKDVCPKAVTRLARAAGRTSIKVRLAVPDEKKDGLGP